MATFTVKIDADSAAFGDETGIEIAIILRGIADDVEEPSFQGSINAHSANRHGQPAL